MIERELGGPARRHLGANSEDRLVNERQAAETLGLKVTTLRRWRWSGDGPAFYKIGNAVRYSLADLQNFIEDGRRNSTSDTGFV